MRLVAGTADETREVGRRLAGLLRGGDLLVLSGDLGAGKTTFTQGLGAGLGVRGDVTSPTFVISRVHPSLAGGPALVHVDAYRLGGLPELDDLDLDTSLDEAVTVVEWGTGVAESLAEDRLEVDIRRAHGDEAGETRTLRITAVGLAVGRRAAAVGRSARSLVRVLLAFDTATPAVTVALHDGERVVASHLTVDARRHGELLAPGITAVLDEAWVPRQDVTAIAVGVGPGPFTGLRVGLVTARTLALALDIPVYGVCTLDVLAAQAVDEGLDVPVPGRDGRPSQGGLLGGVRRAGPAHRRPARGPAGRRGDAGARSSGAGPLLYPEAFPRAVGPGLPNAGVLAGVVTDERAELLDPEPLYLRRPDIADARAPKRVS